MSKKYASRVPTGVLTALVVVLSSLGAFGLGLLEGRALSQKTITTEQVPQVEKKLTTPTTASLSASAGSVLEPTPPALTQGGQYVASKNGSKYHLPWCPGAKAMNEANKIWFSTKAEAEAAGYTPASNCKGI